MYRKFNLFLAAGCGLVGTWLLAAMLGQLDNLLGAWYSNPENKWEFPFPAIFNQQIGALEAWEIMYAVIGVAFALVFVCGYCLGRAEK
jgi:hypothetical protein